MHLNWRRITPAMSFLSSGSSLIRVMYGHTCAPESLSHIAWMSPVYTKVSYSPTGWIVVSSVFGKQLANIHASLSFLSSFVTSWILASTAAETKSLSSSAGRCDSYFLALHAREDATHKNRMIGISLFMICNL